MLSVIIEAYANIPLGATNLAISIPLFIFGAKFIGKAFLFRSILATCEVSLFLFLTTGLQRLQTHNIVAALAGGIFMGIGVGIVILGGGSTGGTDTAALILHKHFNMPLSISIILIDYTVLLLGAALFGFRNALYSIIVIFGLAQSANLVIQGFDKTATKQNKTSKV
ncbi:MAG: YitT family protein [Clostridiales bacterium]|nr:YitT family protein [Clostridiales bacterium]